MKITILSYLIIFSMLFSAPKLEAQEVKEKTPFSIENIGNLSYSGISNLTNITYQIKDIHHVSLGFMYSLSDMYLLGNSNWGFNARYYAQFEMKNNFFSNAGLQFSSLILQSNVADDNNLLHEVLVFYGFGYQINKSFSVANNIGYGGYFESYKSAISNERYSFDGYNFMIQIQLKYQF